MKRQFAQFLVRWGLNLIGIFAAARLLSGVDYRGGWMTLAIAALLLSVVNALVKPALVILALPALVLTVGLFSIVINGVMIYLVHFFYRPFEISSFSTAILAGLIVGLVNYIVTRAFDVLAPEES